MPGQEKPLPETELPASIAIAARGIVRPAFLIRDGERGSV